MLFLTHSRTYLEGGMLQLSPWASDMILKQQEIFELAKQIQEAKDRAHLLEQHPYVTEFENGSYVLANYHSTDGIVRHRGPPNKFLPYLRGPFQVVSHTRDAYTIRSLITHKEEQIHLNELRQFTVHP